MGQLRLGVYRFDGLSLVLVTTQNLSIQVNSVTWSADGSYLFSLDRSSAPLRVWQFNGVTLSQKASTSLGSQVNGLAVAVSPDTRFVGVAAYQTSTLNGNFWYSRFNGTSLSSGFVDTTSPVYTIAWSPDGRFLALGGSTGVQGFYTVYGLRGVGPNFSTVFGVNAFGTIVNSFAWEFRWKVYCCWDRWSCTECFGISNNIQNCAWYSMF